MVNYQIAGTPEGEEVYEYRKLGKMLPVSDLGPYGMYLKETI